MSKLSPRRIDYLIAVFKCSKGKGYARQREIIEELGIEIVKPRSGLWRFAGEEGVRGSEEPEYW